MNAELHCIASGSAGNGYILTAGSERLIIECGVTDNEILKALDYDVSSVVGCVVTHAHKDHSKYIPQYQKFFTVYSNADVAERYNGVVALQPRKRYAIGNFKVMPLEVPHGDCPNFAYVIDFDGTRLVFATDLQKFPYTIANVDVLMLECNNTQERVLQNLMNGDDVMSAYDTHLELEDCVEAVERLGGQKLRKVLLLHLSKHNADRDQIKKRFAEIGIEPEFASAGKIINIGKYDF